MATAVVQPPVVVGDIRINLQVVAVASKSQLTMIETTAAT